MRKICVFLLVLLLTLSACGAKQPAVETTASPETVATEQTEPSVPETPVLSPDALGSLYQDVLDAYDSALAEGWGPERYMEADMNYLPGLIQDANLVGYFLEDLNGDDVPELLIGSVGDSYIYAMYTMEAGKPIMVIRASERNTYQLVSDGGFFNRGSNGAASTGYNFYSFKNNALVFQDALMYDANADPENPWFYAMDEDWDVSNDIPYGTGDAELHIRMVEESIVDIPYIPFAEYRNG